MTTHPRKLGSATVDEIEVERADDYSVRIEGLAIMDKPIYITAYCAIQLRKWLESTEHKTRRTKS